MNDVFRLTDKKLIIVFILSVVLFVISLVKVYFPLGIVVGVFLARIILKRFQRDSENIAPGSPVSSRYMVNMLTYGIVFVLTSLVDIQLFLGTCVGLLAYRQLFFMSFRKKLMEGGLT